MVSNFGYVKTTAGQLKIVTIVLVIVVLGLACVGHFASKYTSNREDVRPLLTANELRSLWREVLLMGAAGVCLAVSVINLIIHLMSREIYWNRRTAIFDFVYHASACILLGCSGVLFVVSAIKIFEINCTTDNECQHFEIKLAAGCLAMVTGLIYGVVSSVVLTNRKDVEREALIEDKNLE